MDEESIWMLAFLISLHNSSSYDEAEIQTSLAAQVADEALKEFYRRFPQDE